MPYNPCLVRWTEICSGFGYGIEWPPIPPKSVPAAGSVGYGGIDSSHKLWRRRGSYGCTWTLLQRGGARFAPYAVRQGPVPVLPSPATRSSCLCCRRRHQLLKQLMRLLLCQFLFAVGFGRDENGLDMDGYHQYYICFHISVRI